MEITELMNYAKVLYSYSAQEEDELDVKQGDFAELLYLNEDNWWIAKSDGRIGLIPSNYVTLSTNGKLLESKNNQQSL